jgi:hypothetical protein
MTATADMHATEEVLEVVFSVRSMPCRVETKSAGSKLRVVRSEKMVAEAGDSSGTHRKGTSAIGSCYQAAQ